MFENITFYKFVNAISIYAKTTQTNSNTDGESITSQKDLYIEQIAQSLENMLELELQMIREDQSNVQ